MNTHAIKQFRAITGASLVVAVNLIRDLVRVESYDTVSDLVDGAIELYRELKYPTNLTEYETELAAYITTSIVEMEQNEQTFFTATTNTEPKPVQKPATKNSVACTIAAKLAKQGVKNPMRVAWKLYELTLDCLHGIADSYSGNYLLSWYRLIDLCYKYGVYVADILPQHTADLLTRYAARH